MKLEELIKAAGARVLQPGRKRGAEITHVFASNKMSALLEQAGPETLLVTALANAQLACLAELMDCPAICLVDGAQPDPKLLEAARRCGTAVVLCPLDMIQTYDSMHRRLCGENFPRP
jgi:hypothetical protein